MRVTTRLLAGVLALLTIATGAISAGVEPADGACIRVGALLDALDAQTGRLGTTERASMNAAGRAFKRSEIRGAKAVGKSLTSARSKARSKQEAAIERASAFCDAKDLPLEPPTTTTTTAPKVGSKFTETNGTIAVYALEFPAAASGTAERIKDPGMSFAVADIEVCPTRGPVTVLGFDFAVTTSDNRRWEQWNVQIGARDPKFNADSLPAGQCSRGWMTFQVADGSTVTGITYTGGNFYNDSIPISSRSLLWSV